MIKRLVCAFITLAVISLGGRYAAGQFVGGDVRKLLFAYGVELTELSCEGGFISRTGHCLFRIANDAAFLQGTLDQDLEIQRPKHQSRMDPMKLGSGLCKEALFGVEPFIPRTQLGGGSLPYLGRIYLDEHESRGCLEFQYGYG